MEFRQHTCPLTIHERYRSRRRRTPDGRKGLPGALASPPRAPTPSSPQPVSQPCLPQKAQKGLPLSLHAFSSPTPCGMCKALALQQSLLSHPESPFPAQSSCRDNDRCFLIQVPCARHGWEEAKLAHDIERVVVVSSRPCLALPVPCSFPKASFLSFLLLSFDTFLKMGKDVFLSYR